MALRQIRIMGDEKLEKVCRPVTEMTPKLRQLVQDMLDTMYDAGGVGLAAPQVGVLKRIVVIDISEEGDEPLILVNPVLLEQSGEQTGQEGCLSLPGQAGMVTRPNHVKIKSFDENMQEFELEADELLARAICHELDHLEGIMYVRHVEGELFDVTEEAEESEEEAEAAKARQRRRAGRGKE